MENIFNTIPHFDQLENLAEKIDQNLPQYLPKLLLNPLTKLALTDEVNAGQKFCDWAKNLAHAWQKTRFMCAAHADTVECAQGEFEQTLVKVSEKMAVGITNATACIIPQN